MDDDLFTTPPSSAQSCRLGNRIMSNKRLKQASTPLRLDANPSSRTR